MARPLRFPAPLRPGDRIAVTAPSAGVTGASAARIEFCLDWLRGRGYDVVVGECLYGDGLTSAPAEQRAAELTRMLADPDIHCVVPPWGGETAIDISAASSGVSWLSCPSGPGAALAPCAAEINAYVPGRTLPNR